MVNFSDSKFIVTAGARVLGLVSTAAASQINNLSMPAIISSSSYNIELPGAFNKVPSP
jgi:hypothetical protein